MIEIVYKTCCIDMFYKQMTHKKSFVYRIIEKNRSNQIISMCGIVGYISSTQNGINLYNHVLHALTRGLQQLEYRGYDSAGICIMSPKGISLDVSAQSDQRFMLIKRVGNVQSLITEAYKQDVCLSYDDNMVKGCWTGIGHTRWSTHGVVSRVNTHPHISYPEANFIVVHNGIITNYATLRSDLEETGCRFVTETDTEVIPVLFQHYYSRMPQLRSSFGKLVTRVVQDLCGYYAFLVVSPLYPNEMALCKWGSPVVVGYNTQTRDFMIASDQSALIGFVDSVADVEDSDIIILKDHGEYLIDNGRLLEWRPFSVTSSFISKGDYRYFMEKEIHEQPISIMSTCKGRLNNIHHNDKIITFDELADMSDVFCTVRRIILLACGSSYNSCMAVRPFFEQIFSLPITIENSCDFLDRDVYISHNDLCIVLSQSGETLDTFMALKTVKAGGAHTLGIVNGVGSSIAKACDHVVYNNIGVEIGVASTKTYTSQVLLLILLAMYFEQMSRSDERLRHKVKIMTEEERGRLICDIHRLPTLIEHILCSSYYMECCRNITLYMKKQKQHSILLIGRKYNVATILEASLKFKEVSYLHCEGIMAGELKHGPLALIDDKMLVMVVATQDAKMNSNIEQLLSRKGRLIIFKDTLDQGKEIHTPRCPEEGHFQGNETGPFTIELPRIQAPLRPIIDIILFQILSFMSAVENGYNVDQPRNLAKSVTVTD